MKPELLARCEAPDGALKLQLRWAEEDIAAGRRRAFDVVLRSAPGELALMFGPSGRCEPWPTFAYRHATFGTDGAWLHLQLDPGIDQAPELGRLRALDLAGRSDRTELLSMLDPLSRLLDPLGSDDARIVQAQAVVRSLPRALASPKRTSPTAATACRPELFAPSTLGVEVDDVHDGDDWSHVRLTYLAPRLEEFWTDLCTWRVFRTPGSVGLEFRDLDGDHPPASVLADGNTDPLGRVLRVGMRLDAPVRPMLPPRGLSEQGLRLLVALARQTARDLPDAIAALREPTPFGTARWRHWLRLLPDMLAAGAGQGVASGACPPMSLTPLHRNAGSFDALHRTSS